MRQECAALASQLKAVRSQLDDHFRNLWDGQLGEDFEGRKIARGRVAALMGSHNQPVYDALMQQEEDFRPAGMQTFRQRHLLSNELGTIAAAGRAEEFWRRAADEMSQRYSEGARQFNDEANRMEDGIIRQMQSLGCLSPPPSAVTPPPAIPPQPPPAAAPPPVAEGPEVVVRRQDGKPLMTDALVTRWLRAYYSLTQGTPSWWRSGRMTEQDYKDVSARIFDYDATAIYSPDFLKPRFTEAEIAALTPRRSDIHNAIARNWSAVRI